MNLLITGAWHNASAYIRRIENLGHEVLFLPDEKDALPCSSEWVEGVIGNGLFLHHPISSFTNLRYIQLTSAGFDRVPMDYVKKNNIEIHNARGVYSIPIAEYVIAGVLELYKGMRTFNENQKEKKWEKQRNLRELAGKTVTIIGCGSVGTECAKRFRAFDTSIIGIDVFTREDPYYDSIKTLSNLDVVLGYSDIVLITVPLTDETEGLFNEERLKLIRDGAIIINVSRGAVLETDSLVNELNTGRISAVLDVFENEPLGGDSILWNLENVIITPHNSFVGEGNDIRLSEVIIRNIQTNRNGKPK